MNWINTKFIALGMAMLALSFGYAQNRETNDQSMKPGAPYKQYRQCDRCQPEEVCDCPCEEIEEDPLMCAYNAPVNTLIKCPMDVFVTASFIYWQAKQKGLELGITDNYCDYCKSGRVLNMEFDYKPGFKVGLGYRSEHDDWDYFIGYTRLHLTDKKKHEVKEKCDEDTFPPCVEIQPAWVTNRDPDVLFYNRAEGKWDFNLDLIDFELSRSYWVGTDLTFHTFVGLRAGWIDQKFNANYHALVDEQGQNVDSGFCYLSKNKSDSWLIGPRVGIGTDWLFGKGFRFFGNTAFALFIKNLKQKSKKSIVKSVVKS